MSVEEALPSAGREALRTPVRSGPPTSAPAPKETNDQFWEKVERESASASPSAPDSVPPSTSPSQGPPAWQGPLSAENLREAFSDALKSFGKGLQSAPGSASDLETNMSLRGFARGLLGFGSWSEARKALLPNPFDADERNALVQGAPERFLSYHPLVGAFQRSKRMFGNALTFLRNDGSYEERAEAGGEWLGSAGAAILGALGSRKLNLNSNEAVSKFGVYEIEIEGQLYKVGKADLARVTQSSGLPTRLHAQLRRLTRIFGEGKVSGEVVENLGTTTSLKAKLAETARLRQIFEETGQVPPGNRKSFKP